MNQEILSRFSYHVPDQAGVQKMRSIRKKVRELAGEIDSLCPEGREKATALTNLASVMMNANAAIVQGYPIDPEEK